ncbi:LSm family protein [Paenibacillus tengchongensis]|uniref:LSm family protein n=1 Tax=Paenibacillus tengchongensis TaxID=2608684 RepID=UPI001651B9CE|nr:LSm family protein [Paenibacillus tengchongensis]
MANTTRVRTQAKRYKGQKVVVTLHNGRTYVGWITDLEKEALILTKEPVKRNRKGKHKPAAGRSSGAKARATTKTHTKAEVKAFMPLLGSFLGGSGAGAALGGGLRFFGMIQRAYPVMKMGYGLVKQIRPFMNGLKGLMGNGAGQGGQAEDSPDAQGAQGGWGGQELQRTPGRWL